MNYMDADDKEIISRYKSLIEFDKHLYKFQGLKSFLDYVNEHSRLDRNTDAIIQIYELEPYHIIAALEANRDEIDSEDIADDEEYSEGTNCRLIRGRNPAAIEIPPLERQFFQTCANLIRLIDDLANGLLLWVNVLPDDLHWKKPHSEQVVSEIFKLRSREHPHTRGLFEFNEQAMRQKLEIALRHFDVFVSYIDTLMLLTDIEIQAMRPVVDVVRKHLQATDKSQVDASVSNTDADRKNIKATEQPKIVHLPHAPEDKAHVPRWRELSLSQCRELYGLPKSNASNKLIRREALDPNVPYIEPIRFNRYRVDTNAERFRK